MADRSLNQPALVYADLPGGDSDQINVTVTDPYGVAVSQGAATSVGDDRYQYLTPILTLSGIYTLAWIYTNSGRIIQHTFSVGQQPVSGITKFMLRAQIAGRVAGVEHGEITAADPGTIADASLIGGADEYRDWWVMLGPESVDAGRIKRVTGYNGSAIELSDEFIEIPLRGDEYMLFEINPREIDRAMEIAINELSEQARIITRIQNILLDTNDDAIVPRGITHITEIWANGTKLLPADYTLYSGRRIHFATTPDAPVDLIGLREAVFPRYEDSIVEVDAASVIARGANFLHANRAGGAAIDVEEHLRRQLAAADDFERAKRIAVGRIPPGTRVVLP